MATMSARYTVIDGEVIAQERGGVRHQLVPDPLGSTVVLYDDSGTKTDTFSYWPYGESSGRTGSTILKFQYIGRFGYYKDNTAINYVRYRYLNTIKTRWMSEDPIGFLDGINIYLYVRNNPLIMFDPLGLARMIVLPGHSYIRFKYRKCTIPADARVYEPRPHEMDPPGDIEAGYGWSFGDWPIGIMSPDPHHYDKNGKIVREDNSRRFENALCQCIIKRARQDEGGSGSWIGNGFCVGWADDIWNCANRIAYPPPKPIFEPPIIGYPHPDYPGRLY